MPKVSIKTKGKAQSSSEEPMDEYEEKMKGPAEQEETTTDTGEEYLPSYEDVLKDLQGIEAKNQQLVTRLVESNERVTKKITELIKSIESMMTNLNNFMSNVRLGVMASGESRNLVEENKRLAETNEELINRLARLERKMKEFELHSTLEKYPMRKDGEL